MDVVLIRSGDQFLTCLILYVYIEGEIHSSFLVWERILTGHSLPSDKPHEINSTTFTGCCQLIHGQCLAQIPGEIWIVAPGKTAAV